MKWTITGADDYSAGIRDGQTVIGAANVEQKTLDAIAAGEEALKRIEREKAKYLN